MFRKNHLSIIALASTLLVFSGCGPKYLKTSTSLDAQTHVGTIVAAGEGKEFGFINHASLLNNAINYPLQIAAEKTLDSGMKYFSIMEPVEISNDGPGGVGTVEDFIKKCSNNSFLESMAYLKNPCKIAMGNLKYPAGGVLKIKMYNDSNRPSNILSYDAKAVLDYMKTNDLIQEAH